VLIAVTNRHKTQVPDSPRSRGLLAREMLECESAAEAVALAAAELGRGSYAGCNFLCADLEEATVIHASDWLRVRPLPPGLHVLTSHDVNDASDRRLGHAHWWLSQRGFENADDAVRALKELCAQKGNHDPPMCVHGREGGTVSSSIIALRADRGRSVYLHAQGPPDQTPYKDYSHLLAACSAAGNSQH
jgi:uncharacterized protein with NRDE domain